MKVNTKISESVENTDDLFQDMQDELYSCMLDYDDEPDISCELDDTNGNTTISYSVKVDDDNAVDSLKSEIREKMEKTVNDSGAYKVVSNEEVSDKDGILKFKMCVSPVAKEQTNKGTDTVEKSEKDSFDEATNKYFTKILESTKLEESSEYSEAVYDVQNSIKKLVDMAADRVGRDSAMRQVHSLIENYFNTL